MKTYTLEIDKLDMETGMICVSLVDCPAVESDFLKFDKQNPEFPHKLQFQDEEKHIITGVALRADYPIYRYNEQYGDHYVVFPKELIKQLVEKYAKMGLYNQVNLNHDESNYINGNLVMIESYFIDKSRGICPQEFADIEDGSWIISYKIQDIDLWNKIKDGDFKGFSIEGLFTYSDNPVDMKKEETFDEWIENITKSL